MNRGAAHHLWKGGRNKVDEQGYMRAYSPDHPRAHDRHVLEHILIAEKALGRHLPPKAEIHHIDEDPSNNDPSNLVICQSRSYHKLLHRRLRALKACGNPNALFCVYCKGYDRQEAMRVRTDGNGVHRDCKHSYDKAWRDKRRAKVSA